MVISCGGNENWLQQQFIRWRQESHLSRPDLFHGPDHEGPRGVVPVVVAVGLAAVVDPGDGGEHGQVGRGGGGHAERVGLDDAEPEEKTAILSLAVVYTISLLQPGLVPLPREDVREGEEPPQVPVRQLVQLPVELGTDETVVVVVARGTEVVAAEVTAGVESHADKGRLLDYLCT